LQAPDYVPPFEPTALAAVLSVNEMRQLAIDGMTMVVVTHEMGLAREAADSVVFIDEGLITESGPRKRRSARHITREREPSWRRLCEGTPLP
jgi:ABC-type polar amino acid transport system ATPase subunit